MNNGREAAQKYFDEAVRYYRNSREILARCAIEYDAYKDAKPVQEAFGTAWLAVLKALRGALVAAGVPPKQLPRSFDAYAQLVRKHLAFRNGKLVRLLQVAYSEIHVSGYYAGDLLTTETVKAAFQTARRIIETVSGRPVQ